jgi:hypothetical protein
MDSMSMRRESSLCTAPHANSAATEFIFPRRLATVSALYPWAVTRSTATQGLTLVQCSLQRRHFLWVARVKFPAWREHFLWYMCGAIDQATQVKLRSGHLMWLR